MENNFIKIYFVFLLTLFISCNEKNVKNNSLEKNNPEALQENSVLKGYTKRGGNLVDQLYEEIVEKNSDLQKLETEITEFESEPYDTQNIFKNYEEKSKHYYNNASDFAKQINDSVTKNKILDIISKSSEKYNKQSSKVSELVAEIKNKENTIETNHNILKIILTLPIIEKYQIENLPKNSIFEKIIEKQIELNKKIENRTQKK